MDRFKETKPYTFAALVKNFERFSIPNFQRSYSWSNQHITELWNSLITNTPPHFIGNIVCVEATDASDNRIEVVDGQQRLTTITIAIIALRDKYLATQASSEIESQTIKAAEGRLNNYLIGYDHEVITPNEGYYVRLILNNNSYQEALKKLIYHEEYTQSERRTLNDVQKKIIRNYQIIQKLIDKHVNEQVDDQAGLSILDILSDIESRILKLQVILIEVKNEADIYSIFEGLNSTGVGLSASDLVKNAVLRYTQHDKEAADIVEKNWDQLESIFLEYGRSDQLPRFLRHQWISENGYINTSDLFKAIRDDKLVNRSANEIVNYTGELVNDADIYMAVKEWKNIDKFEFSSRIKKELEKFHWLNNQQMYEILLSYLKRHLKRDGFKDSQLSRALTNLWNFAFRSTYVSVSPSSYEKHFADHSLEILNKQPSQLVEAIDEFYENMEKLVSSKDQFVDNLSSDIKYKSENVPLIKYLISGVMSRDNPTIEVRKPTIEHILPQEPKKWGLQKRDISSFVNSIGNLTLLNDMENSNTASNENFEYKLNNVYNNSAFDINKNIKNYEDFPVNPETTISARARDLAKQIEEVFRVV